MLPPDSCHYQFIQCSEYYGRYDLSFGHDLIEYRRVDDVTENCFYWFSTTWRAIFENVCENISD